MEEKSTMWFFGCSMTFGIGCHEGDKYNEKYRKKGDEIWTKIVAGNMGYNEKNMGIPGYDNIEIFKTILDNKDNIKKDDIVIVGITDGSRVQSFRTVNSVVVPISLNHWMIDGFPREENGLDDDFIVSMKQYMVNCRLKFNDEHMKYDRGLMESVISLINPKDSLFWGTDIWNNFETIAIHTKGEIFDGHWSFNGHKQMSQWVLRNKFNKLI